MPPPWRLDGALSNLVWWKVSLPMAGRLELDDLQDPLQPKAFHDFMILLSARIFPEN